MKNNVFFSFLGILVFIGLILATETQVNGGSGLFGVDERRIPSRFGRITRSQEHGISNMTEIEPRGVYWLPTTCDSMAERGYTCHSCGEVLHCMLGNFGLVAFCIGRRPYCNNGVCSGHPGTKCEKTEATVETTTEYNIL